MASRKSDPVVDVHTQDELDDAVSRGIVPHCRGMSTFGIHNKTKVFAHDSCSIHAYDDAYVVADGACTIFLEDNSIAEASGKCKVLARGNSTADVRDYATVDAFDRLKPAASHAVSTAVDKAGFLSSFSCQSCRVC